jgi:hypothetical protein
MLTFRISVELAFSVARDCHLFIDWFQTPDFDRTVHELSDKRECDRCYSLNSNDIRLESNQIVRSIDKRDDFTTQGSARNVKQQARQCSWVVQSRSSMPFRINVGWLSSICVVSYDWQVFSVSVSELCSSRSSTVTCTVRLCQWHNVISVVDRWERMHPNTKWCWQIYLLARDCVEGYGKVV